MGTTNILAQLRAAGLNLEVDATGRLLVWPPDRITPELRATIQAHRDALIAGLLNQEQNALEAYEERAGILEYDVGMTRPEAEAEAARLVVVRFKLTDPPGDRGGSVITATASAEDVIAALKVRYAERLMYAQPATTTARTPE